MFSNVAHVSKHWMFMSFCLFSFLLQSPVLQKVAHVRSVEWSDEMQTGFCLFRGLFKALTDFCLPEVKTQS